MSRISQFGEDDPFRYVKVLADRDKYWKRLHWLFKDMADEEGIGIYYEDGRYRYPYLMNGVGGWGGGVGEVAFDTLEEAIDEAMILESRIR